MQYLIFIFADSKYAVNRNVYLLATNTSENMKNTNM